MHTSDIKFPDQRHHFCDPDSDILRPKNQTVLGDAHYSTIAVINRSVVTVPSISVLLVLCDSLLR